MHDGCRRAAREVGDVRPTRREQQMSGARKHKPSRVAADDGIPLAEQAYTAVRDAIDRGVINPGDRVSEYHVAGLLNISRTPAREALLRLTAEGLLGHDERRGLVVIDLDESALEEVYEARGLLEETLAQMAARNGSGPELKAIMRMSESEPAIMNDREAMYRHNREFHELIYRAAHNRYLHKSCVSMHELIAADRRGSNLVDESRREQIVAEHRLIAQAIFERRSDEAGAAAKEHVLSARRTRLNRG